MIERHDIKTAIDLADQLPDTQDSFRISTTLMACGNEIESLRAEIEALKQQVEQGKWDAVPEDILKDAERYLWLKSQKGLDLS